MRSLLLAAEAELRQRHDFFVAWFTGRGSPGAMDTTARAFARDMQRIGPDGVSQNAEEVIAMIRTAEGRIDGSFSIDIELNCARLLADDLALLVYDEHQRINTAATSRRSSALFSPGRDAPEGAVWRHLQETWIAP